MRKIIASDPRKGQADSDHCAAMFHLILAKVDTEIEVVAGVEIDDWTGLHSYDGHSIGCDRL